jgi:hypothetical protein
VFSAIWVQPRPLISPASARQCVSLCVNGIAH